MRDRLGEGKYGGEKTTLEKRELFLRFRQKCSFGMGYG